MKKLIIKTQKLIIFLVLFTLVTASGCATQSDLSKVNTLRDNTTHIRAQLQVLREEMARQEELKKLTIYIERLETLVKKQMDELWKMRADLGQRVNSLENQLRILDTRISENDRQFSTLVRKLEGIKVKLNTTDRTDKTIAPVQGIDAGHLYDLALRDYQLGNYEVAIQQFLQYSEYFSDSALVDDAQYYIGECYYTQSLYTQALDAYTIVLNLKKDGNKIPAALLKIAFIKLARKKQAEARAYLGRVIQEHPNSNEAQLAKMRLDLMPGY